MRRALVLTGFLLPFAVFAAQAGDNEVKAAQRSIDAQLRAFLAGDDALAYSYAAPNIKRIFPTLQSFMMMVESGYQPVAKPQSYSFGKSSEQSGAITQQVFLVGPDGKDYEAIYTLELQPDGSFKITGVSLRGAKSLST
jgi:hypothetical protein